MWCFTEPNGWSVAINASCLFYAGWKDEVRSNGRMNYKVIHGQPRCYEQKQENKNESGRKTTIFGYPRYHRPVDIIEVYRHHESHNPASKLDPSFASIAHSPKTHSHPSSHNSTNHIDRRQYETIRHHSPQVGHHQKQIESLCSSRYNPYSAPLSIFPSIFAEWPEVMCLGCGGLAKYSRLVMGPFLSCC